MKMVAQLEIRLRWILIQSEVQQAVQQPSQLRLLASQQASRHYFHHAFETQLGSVLRQDRLVMA